MTNAPLDEQVPKYRRNARRVVIRVDDSKETGSSAIIVVRVIYQRGGGSYYYVLRHIEEIHQFYPKEMGQDVIDAVLVVWAEHQLGMPFRPTTRDYTTTNFTKEADGWKISTVNGSITRL